MAQREVPAVPNGSPAVRVSLEKPKEYVRSRNVRGPLVSQPKTFFERIERFVNLNCLFLKLGRVTNAHRILAITTTGN